MEVHQTSTAESELRLRHCSSDQTVSIFADTPEGRVITFCAKSANLTDNWNATVAFATKKVDHFEVFFEKDPENKLIFNNDDESKSLLSSNLWEIGWYSLVEENQHMTSQKPTDISKEGNNFNDTEMEEVSMIRQFKGRSFECTNGTLFASFVFSRASGEVTHDQSGCVFADEIRGMARVFGRHMLASDNCQRAPCTCHVAQDTADRRGLGPL